MNKRQIKKLNDKILNFEFLEAASFHEYKIKMHESHENIIENYRPLRLARSAAEFGGFCPQEALDNMYIRFSRKRKRKIIGSSLNWFRNSDFKEDVK